MVGIGGLDVVNGGQVTVAPFVVHREGCTFVVGGWVGAVEGVCDDGGIGWEVQAQGDQGRLFGFTGGFLGDGQDHAFIHVRTTG